MSAETEWWLTEPDDNRELIGLIRKLTINEQHEMTERLKDLSEPKPVFEYTQSPASDPLPIIP